MKILDSSLILKSKRFGLKEKKKRDRKKKGRGDKDMVAEHSNPPAFIQMEPQNLLRSINCYPSC